VKFLPEKRPKSKNISIDVAMYELFNKFQQMVISRSCLEAQKGRESC
jgi:hypothetical protein